MKKPNASVLIVVCLAATATIAIAQTEALIPVPFVGCAADGQMGPVAAPSAGPSIPLVPESVAPQLAYYASTDLGGLAPRGWHCVGLYGSSGTTLIVTPEQHEATELLHANTPLTGAAVELSRISGGTSGRFEVAKISARVFPVAQAFVQQVIGEGLIPESEFPSGSYPGDTLDRRSDTVVEFVTPADTEGLGTGSRLAKNGEAIHGVALLLPEEEMDLVLLRARLPSSLQGLAPAIVRAVEANPSFPKK